MRNCDKCHYQDGGCSYWMTAKGVCSHFVAWPEVITYLAGKVSLKPP